MQIFLKNYFSFQFFPFFLNINLVKNKINKNQEIIVFINNYLT